MKQKLKKIAIVLVMLTLIGLAFIYDSILSGTFLTIIFGCLYWIGSKLNKFKIFNS